MNYVVSTNEEQTLSGFPHNLRKYKSDSDAIIPGGNLSAPRGFEGSHICTKTCLKLWFCSWNMKQICVHSYIKHAFEISLVLAGVANSEFLSEIAMEWRRFLGRLAYTIQNIMQQIEKKNLRRRRKDLKRMRRRTLAIQKDGKDSPRRMPKAIANKAVVRSFMLSSDLLLLVGL